MKLVVLHGDNTLESYKRKETFIDVAQERGWVVCSVNSASKSLEETLVSDTLFQEKRLVILEDFKLLDKKTLQRLKGKEKLDVTLIIYHPGTLNKTFLKSLPKPDKIEEFPLPKLIWSFLESFYPGNPTNVIKLLHNITVKDPIEFVFSLLSRHLRDLYWVKTDPKTLTLPPWRIGKLKNQAGKFTESQLADIISEFAEADIKTKTSDAKLLDLLDFIIATKLE